MDDIGPV
jgi:hypothetical protein